DELTHMLVAADREVELAVEMKIVSPSDGAIENAVLDWLQRWGWHMETGRLWPNGVTSQVHVSVMSFSVEALRRVGQRVPAANLCLLFDQQAQPDAAAVMLGPSVHWLRQQWLVRSWVNAGRTIR